ncbi:MAG: HDOD domain-containing protein [Rhodocyclaceae bacterium]|nr:HDOD domain-containing protein [Rhodocyclaceae bacterium]
MHISAALEQRLTLAVERMPAFPESVQRILELTRDANCLPKDLVGVIEKDPVMTMKILRVINSAYYGLPQKIHSITQSVVYLGINTIKNLALSFAMIGILPRKASPVFDIQQYLAHSLSVALSARLLCERYARNEADASDAYLAGLLHDFGKVVFVRSMEEAFEKALALAKAEKIPLFMAERETIGVDHAYVGALLAQKWKFGESLVACIRDHHDPGAVSPLLDCLRAADLVCRQRGYGDAGNPWRQEEAAGLAPRFGQSLDALLGALGDLTGIYEEALRFVQLGKEGT